MSDTNKRIADWLFGGNTGTSSKAMAAHLSGRKAENSYPSDGGDFGRCMGLLASVPEFRARIGEMATLSKQWATLAAHWSELEALYEREPRGDKLYERMKALLRPVEAKDPNIVRLSDTASIHFRSR